MPCLDTERELRQFRGGATFENCAILLNNEFERVFYKNDYSFGVTIFNLYMVCTS